MLPPASVLAAGVAAVAWAALAESAPALPGWVHVAPLLLIAGSLFGLPFERTRGARGLAIVFALLCFAAAAGVWTAPDRIHAAGKVGLIVGGMGLAASLARIRSDAQLTASLLVLALGGAALGLFFIATNDPLAPPVKFMWLAKVGEAFAARSPLRGVPGLHPNVVAGVLACLWPFAVAVALGAKRPHPRLAGALVVLIGFAMLLTASRGAWLAAFTAAGFWVAARSGRRARTTASVLAAAIAVVVAASLPAIAGAWSAHGRWSIQSHAATLVRDYFFTGAGLGSFPMQYAVYAEAGTVQSSVHAHHLLLDILIEQGIAGLLAWTMLAIVTARVAWAAHQVSSGIGRLAAQAALVSLASAMIHGLLDDTLYESRGLPALFLPAGVALGAARVAGLAPVRRSASRLLLRAGGVVAVAAAITAILPAGRAAARANLAAVRQARAELSLYDQSRFDVLTLDDVRLRVDLANAVAGFSDALASSPGQPTASRRLAMIALARGSYLDALALMETTWAAGHRDRTSLLLLADALVANGEIDAAVRLLRGTSGGADRLKSQAWYRYWTHGDYARARDAWIAAAALDPGDAEARRMAAEAAVRAGPRGPTASEARP
ncbi:MAG: O-antigen ligase family protein [Vicinamibacterales bacterium]